MLVILLMIYASFVTTLYLLLPHCSFYFVVVNQCPQRNCPTEGYQGQNCSCFCDSGNRNNPVKLCDGVGKSFVNLCATQC